MSWVSPDGSAEGLGETLDTRESLLAALAAGAQNKRALREELGVARSTVYKGLRELTELGLVRETADGYALTASGRLAQRMHATYRERLELLADAQSVLASIPADAGVPPAFLEDATVATADRHAPERPLTVFDDDGAALTTYDDGGVSGLLHSTADGAVAWARGTYESYRERGERL